jgi:hypothetical protein
MPIETLAPDVPFERLVEVIERDGCAVIDQLVSRDEMDRVRAECSPSSMPRRTARMSSWATTRGASAV